MPRCTRARKANDTTRGDARRRGRIQASRSFNSSGMTLPNTLYRMSALKPFVNMESSTATRPEPAMPRAERDLPKVRKDETMKDAEAGHDQQIERSTAKTSRTMKQHCAPNALPGMSSPPASSAPFCADGFSDIPPTPVVPK